MHFQGWVKLHRKIMDNEVIWDTKEPFDRRSAWMYLVMMANHEDRQIRINNSVRTIYRGEHWTSIRSLAEKWNWGKDRVRAFLNVLVEAGMATVETTPIGTLVSLVNYGEYQHSPDTKTDTLKDTIKDTNRTGTGTDTRYKQEERINKNDKEEKNTCADAPVYGGDWQ